MNKLNLKPPNLLYYLNILYIQDDLGGKALGDSVLR